MISAVIFDVFGTIARIGQRTSPYLDLFREVRRNGCALSLDMTRMAMTTDLSFDELADRLGVELTSWKRNKLNRALQLELLSIEPYSDAVDAISRLQRAGVKTGSCSNLAAPYGPVVRKFFPEMDAYAFSYELGVMKPEPAIYQSVCQQMGVTPGNYFNGEAGRVLMIGDSQRCDRAGPRSVGIMGYHLNRSGRGHITDLKQFAELVIAHNCVEGAARD